MRLESLHIMSEVGRALANGQPVVALDSTVIAHELPHPTNLEMALAAEQIIRVAGAVPATLAIMEGQIKVGLTEEEIRQVATGKRILKAGERDIPMIVARQLTATTTTSASLAIAAAAGIRVFVTSGIGGVGPSATTDFDISADLTAIAEYRCITVCAGTKAFMDTAGTLEFLETHRVPVVVYRSDYFPLFYSRGSEHKADWVVQEAKEIAECFAVKQLLGLDGGLLVAIPLSEAEAVPVSIIRSAIDIALERSRAQQISGKAVTPFVFSVIDEVTGGRSTEANVALVKNNTQIGAEIAVALASAVRSL